MRMLTWLHRWAGGLVGMLLALIGLSGTILLWEEAWIGLPGADDALVADNAAIAAAVARAGELGELTRITFASEDFGLHMAAYADGAGAYFDQRGQLVDRWTGLWDRPELWLFDFHHYLFAGEVGEIVTGTLGLLLIFFVISGAILWWRTRKTYEFRLWPKRMSRTAIIRHHRDIGVVATPMLLLSALTGAFMLFPSVSQAVLTPFGQSLESAVPAVDTRASQPHRVEDMLARAQRRFPGAVPRRLQIPGDEGQPSLLRMKQAFEWTPNGRTYVYLHPADGSVIATVDPAAADTTHAIEEKYYPLHAGKVGGVLWKLALTLGGLALVMLGAFASWSFWFAKPPRPVART